MGKKFNSKKENAQGEKFKGIQIIRFWIRCGTCGNQMTFKTDPENDDYQMESGGTRTFEVWQEKKAVQASNLQERLEEDKEDAMTSLENRTRDTQKMVDMLDALDELKAVSQRNERIDTSVLLNSVDVSRKAVIAQLDKEDDEIVKSIKFGGIASSLKSVIQNDEFEEEESSQFVLPELEASGEEHRGKGKSKKRARKIPPSAVPVGVASQPFTSQQFDTDDTLAIPHKSVSASIDAAPISDVVAEPDNTKSTVGSQSSHQIPSKSIDNDINSSFIPTLIKRKKIEVKQVKSIKSDLPVETETALLGLGDYGSSSDPD